MRITAITLQTRDKNRVNVSVDGSYRFSLDIAQVIDLGIKVGNEYSQQQLIDIESESLFGKLYMRALEYCLRRYHSSFEIKTYLNSKSRPTRDKKGNIKPGYSQIVIDRVYDKLCEKGYVDDVRFATYWIENRSLKKGVSRRKMTNELIKKGVSKSTIESILRSSSRSDSDEMQKIILKKRSKYPDDKKLVKYLLGQGFEYDDVKKAVNFKEDD